MSSDATVFGISPGLRSYSDRHFVFVPVSATVHDRRLRPVTDPQEEFPTEGNVFLAEEFWIPPTGVGAIWRVRRRAPATERPYAEYSVIARGREGPLEIVSVPVSSSQPAGVRELLCAGVDLGYTTATTVLLRLADGVVIGPIKGEMWSEENVSGFRCDPDAFSEPLDLWSTVTALEPFQVDASYALDRRRRTFTSYLDLPQAERWFDGAAFADCVRSVLKHAAASKDGAQLLSRRQMNELAKTLSDETFPERFMARAKRVQRAVQSLALTQEELDALLPAVTESEQVQRELDELRERIRTEEVARIAEEEKDAHTRVSELRATAVSLEERIQGLTERIPQVEKEIEAAEHRAVERAQERLSAAIGDPAELLAQVALLRPFIARAGVPAPVSSNGGTPDEDYRPAPLVALGESTLTESAHSESPPASTDELLSQLRDGLRIASLTTGTARLLARDVLAALLAGQVPVFSGSLATLVARACAIGCVGRGSYIQCIPVGLLDDGQVRHGLQRIAATAAESGALAALVLDGLDRSAVEVYGGTLRMLVAERVLGVGNQWPGLLLFGTLVGGPSALPITPALSELGPIFETDVLTLSARPAEVQSSPKAPLVSDWSSWCRVVRSEPRGGDDAEAIDELCDALSGEESLLWRRGVMAASRGIRAFGENSDQASLDAIVGGWVLPRARAVGISDARLGTALHEAGVENRDGKGDGTGADPRLSRLLKRYGIGEAFSGSPAMPPTGLNAHGR